jgi:ATP-dependent RNA helicase RhlE
MSNSSNSKSRSNSSGSRSNSSSKKPSGSKSRSSSSSSRSSSSDRRPSGSSSRSSSSDRRPSGSSSRSSSSDRRPSGSGSRSSSSDRRPSGSSSRTYSSDRRPSGSDSRSSSSDRRPSGSSSRSSSSDRRPSGSSSRTYSSDRRSGSSSSTGKPIGYRSDRSTRSFSSGGSRGGFGGGGGRGRGYGRSGGRKEIKKFDPSMFIKKVEERTATPAYVPKHTFNDFDIDKRVKSNIAAKGYKTPTPVQDEAIPLLLKGKDIVASANTGTGKTAAFLIPLVSNVLAGKVDRVLIIAPTRELADQIQGELRAFKARIGLTSALCIGGANIGYQIRQLRKKPEFVIGTPGRLMDLERNGIINFKNYNAIVLDEVDTMLDMGFITDIKEIVAKLPAKRQSLFFSATIPPKLKDIMDGFLHNPEKVSVQTRQSAENVNQDVIKVGSKDKIELLHDLLIKPEAKKVIIFSRTKRYADKLSVILRDRGFKVATIHGDRSQAQRKRALDMVKNDKVQILLATDVVARGIDINDISHVINYDMPQSYEDYIHRIGRTGRANKIGQAITFID